MLKAMLVDDEVLTIKMLESIVDWSRYGIGIVATATDGEEALAKYRSLSPDIIVTDIRMPRLDGIEFIRRLRTAGAESEFIFISAYADFNYVKEAIQLGGANYLLKPIDEVELEKTLQGIVTKISDKTIVKKLVTQDGQNRKRFLLYDYMSTGRGADAARQAFLEYAAPGSPFVVASVSPSEETINDYAGLNSFTGEQMRYLLARMRQEIERSCACIPFEYDGSAWTVLLFSGSVRQIVPICESLLRFLHGQFGIWARVAFSRPAKRVQELPALYGQVRQYVKYGRYVDRTDIFGYGYNCSEAGFDKIKLSALASNMREALRQRNKTEVDRILNSVFRMSENIDPQYLHDIYEFCFVTVLGIRDILLSSPGAAEPGTKVLTATYEDILAIPSLKRLKEFMAGAAELLSVPVRSEGRKYCELVENGIDFLKENYNRNLSLEEICGHLSVSKNYFSYLFKRDTGISLWAFLTRIRIEQARIFLENTDWKNYEVAYNVGYDNPSYFNKLFKKYTGQTPNEYRAGKRREHKP